MEDIVYLSSDIVNDYSIIATHIITKPTACALHSHGFYECFYIIQGSALHYIGGNQEHLQAGDFYLLPPGTVHQFLHAQQSDCVRRDVMIPIKQFTRTLQFLEEDGQIGLLQQGVVKLRLSVEKVKQAEELLNRFSSIKEDEALRNAYSNMVCVKLMQFILDQRAETYSDMPLWVLQIIQKLALPDSYTRPLQTLLEPYNYNRSYMARAFKKHIGMPISEYFVLQKLHYACLLLHTTSAPIAQISEQAGFHNLSYFNRCFKTQFSLTPKEYRKQIAPMADK